MNTFKHEKDSERRGADVEKSDLCTLFTDLGLEVKSAQDLSAGGMKEFLKEISKESSLEEHSVLVVAISSHGEEKGILGAGGSGGEDEGGIVSHKEIVSIFANENCPALFGKPKVFIFNSCRGNEVVKKLERIESFEGIPEKVLFNTSKNTATTSSADIFKVFSCLEGSISLRKPNRGSLFLSILCECWRKFGNEMSLADVVTQVNGQLTKFVYREDGDHLSQCCINEGTLRAILCIGVVGGRDGDTIEKDCKRAPVQPRSKNPKQRTNSFYRKSKKTEITEPNYDQRNEPTSSTYQSNHEPHPEKNLNPMMKDETSSNQEVRNTTNEPTEPNKPTPIPPPAPTEFYLGAASFDGINTVYLTDSLNARVWCCDIIRKGVTGFIYDPVFAQNQPFGVAADDRFVIVTCGTILLAFDAVKLLKVKEFEHKLANFSAVDISNNQVFVASNLYKFSLYTGTYALDMKPMELSIHGSDLKPDVYLNDVKVTEKYIFLLFDDINNPLCIFGLQGNFLFTMSLAPAQYKYFAINHLSALIMLGETSSGVIRTLDMNNETWMEEVFPAIEGLHLTGITLIAPNVLFAAVNTDKPKECLEEQCLLLNLNLENIV